MKESGARGRERGTIAARGPSLSLCPVRLAWVCELDVGGGRVGRVSRGAGVLSEGDVVCAMDGITRRFSVVSRVTCVCV